MFGMGTGVTLLLWPPGNWCLGFLPTASYAAVKGIVPEHLYPAAAPGGAMADCQKTLNTLQCDSLFDHTATLIERSE